MSPRRLTALGVLGAALIGVVLAAVGVLITNLATAVIFVVGVGIAAAIDLTRNRNSRR